MLTIKVSEAEGRLKLTTKKEEESEGGEGYIHVAKGRVGQITLVFPWHKVLPYSSFPE